MTDAPPNLRPISEIVSSLGIPDDRWRPMGTDVAKLDPTIPELPREREAPSRLVLVSAMTPTPAGEGKTTTVIGLGQALSRLGQSACITLREPSMGPTFGRKGGATGGGRSRVLPEERINLHFTGDLHAITSAHNLLAALLDNHLHRGNELGIDPRREVWRRVIDMNDRALRNVVVGLGGPADGVPRETGFDITAASEVMAILCLAESLEDLRERLGRIICAHTRTGEAIRARDLKGTGAMTRLLADAFWPNLVQTLEGTPAIIHGGPFANIAHGCNSLIALRLAMHTSDWVVTEAGFGFDLGAEKFYDILCTGAGLDTAAVVLVATLRALKMHGGVALSAVGEPDPEAVRRGLPNLAKHIENIGHFHEVPIVALNEFAGDTEEEKAVVREFCESQDTPFVVSSHFAEGGAGAEGLARLVMERAEETSRPFTPLYDAGDSVPDKILAVARKMYGARGLIFRSRAREDLKRIEREGLSHLPVCIAKTQNSLSDDPSRRGRPTNFDVTVREIGINAGAGFLVVLTGKILRMPGLPAHPRAEEM